MSHTPLISCRQRLEAKYACAIAMLRLITSCYIRLYSLPNSTEKANNKAYVLVIILEGLF